MSESNIPIPEEYKSQLRYVPSKDTRTDADIVVSLTQNVPRNIINWVRLHGSDWTVRVLDKVPDSANYALKWIDPSVLPETFVKGTMTGPYVGPHSADFLRGAALHAYGGVWMDVGSILFRHLDQICWNQLANESSPYTICIPWIFEQYVANHFVAARKGDPFIKKWHDLFIHLWKDRTDFTGVIQSPLINFMQDFKYSQVEERGFKWDYSVDEQTLLGYTGQCVAWVRVTWLQEPDGGFDGVNYWAKKVLLFDAGAEDFPAEMMVGFKAVDILKVFATRRDADPESEDYKKAEKTAWSLLSASTMQKITHGKNLTHSPHCGTLLDLAENEGKDQEPGTFGELLRYGSVHLEQTRSSIAYVDPVVVAPEFILQKGLFEP